MGREKEHREPHAFTCHLRRKETTAAKLKSKSKVFFCKQRTVYSVLFVKNDE